MELQTIDIFDGEFSWASFDDASLASDLARIGPDWIGSAGYYEGRYRIPGQVLHEPRLFPLTAYCRTCGGFIGHPKAEPYCPSCA